ncbi:MAG: NUDIX hydrolase, partial [Anaerolineae bacterium]|nr:NUDIX hydrolase [Anaerolineae bacterium]
RFTMGVVGVLPDAAGERLLLVEHLFHPYKPWGLPGGWLNRGEGPAEAVVREFREETGLRVRAVRPLLIKSEWGLRRHMNAVYLCALDGENQSVRLNGELLDYRWTTPDDLPPLANFHRAGIAAVFGDVVVSECEEPHP